MDKRDAETLMGIIKVNVEPGTTVVTDGWAAYKGLCEQGYKHYVHHKPSQLLQQSPDWRSEEDDRQVATCPQLGSTNRLEHAQVRPGTYSFPAKSATLAGRCRPGSVQSLRPGVQMSAQDGS